VAILATAFFRYFVAIAIVSLPSMSFGDECSWPESVEEGVVELRFRVSEVCEPISTEYLRSEPQGAFDEYVNCQIRDVPALHFLPSGAPPRSLSQPEYQDHLVTYREKNPGRYHLRKIWVSLVESDPSPVALLTCYFTSDWVPTEAEISTFDEKGEMQNSAFQDFEGLPDQLRSYQFTTEVEP
jgi:hypothetical protein